MRFFFFFQGASPPAVTAISGSRGVARCVHARMHARGGGGGWGRLRSSVTTTQPAALTVLLTAAPAFACARVATCVDGQARAHAQVRGRVLIIGAAWPQIRARLCPWCVRTHAWHAGNSSVRSGRPVFTYAHRLTVVAINTYNRARTQPRRAR